MNNKQKIRGIVILLLIIFWIFSVLSGFILYFTPQGPRSGQMVILGFQKRAWIQIHFWLSFLTAIITVIHIILEWQILVPLLKKISN